ncbi:PEP-CTERM putative exosortase interaction domain protein [gamma proteobacterium NOR5-3]|nr:PEP-CTERM putative exosortase interaction domain protein [gamma proteobacterium NOR5-3]
MRYSKFIAGLTLATCSSLASAGLVIDSINVQMVSTTFTARHLGGTDEERYTAALNAFESSEGSVCSQDLGALEGVSYSGTCGGGKRNYGALYTITGSLSGGAEFQFGLDWGRGGFIFADSAGAPLDYFNEDIWWSKNWGNSDVKSYVLADAGDFSLTLLGFEGCCDGINSAQYRTWETPEISSFSESPQIPVGNASEWSTLEVNAVPVPGSLPLMAVGALLLWRRRQS